MVGRILNWFSSRSCPEERLTDDELQSGLHSVIKDGIATQAMVALTSGVLIIDFALTLGASNLFIGIIASIPTFSQLAQVPATYLVERIRRRKSICLVAATLARSMWFPMAMVPFLPEERRLTALFILLALNSILSAVSLSSWSSWMKDLIPQERLGSFFSRRMSLSYLASIPLGLGAGIFVDWWKETFPGLSPYCYTVVFTLGFVVGMVGIKFIAETPEPAMGERDEELRPLSEMALPLKERNFRNLMVSMGIWNFAVNLASPFFAVYMIKGLGLSMAWVVGLTVLNQLSSLAFLRTWGGLSDRFGNKPVLSASAPIFVAATFLWTFTTMPGKYSLTLPLLVALHVVMGISAAGVSLSAGNISLKLAPREHAAAFLSAINAANAILAGTASVLGGVLAELFSKVEFEWMVNFKAPGRSLSFPVLSLERWDFLFLLSSLVGLYSLHRLRLVREEGEAGRKPVLHEIVLMAKRPMRFLSSSPGLRYMLQLPTIILTRTVKGKSRRS